VRRRSWPLNHPHIAAIYGLEEDAGSPFLVLELVQGEDLAERLARGPIPMDEALEIARQIAKALEGAHEKGIVHRDLKPANVKVTPDGTVKVLDFGLAKAWEGDSTASSSSDLSQSPTLARSGTMAGVLLGTAAYMSPEQAKGKAVDKRADVWAFGALVYEMLTGQRAFQGEDVSDTLAAVLRAEADLGHLPKETAPAVRRVLKLCLTKDPKRRIHDMADVRLAMDGAFDTASEASDRAPRARPALWQSPVGLAVVALAAFGLGLAVWRARAPADPPPLIRTTIQPPEGLEFDDLALSPDGTHLAFTDDRVEENRRLWVRPLGALEAVPLDGTDGAQLPFWSPDSRSLGFFAEGELKIVSAAGGTPRILTAAPAPDGGAWNDEGIILFASGPGGVVYRVAAAGGVSTAVTTRERGDRHRRPAFLPDGRHFTFSTFGPPDTVFLGDLQTGAVRELVMNASEATYAPPGFLLYAPRPFQLFAQRFDATRLELLDESRSLIPRVFSPGGHTQYAVSPTGLLAYVTREYEGDLKVWRDRRGVELRSNALPDDALGWMYRLSPSGTRLALGGFELRVLDLERGIVQVLPVAKDYGPIMFHPTWSPDGSRIAYFTSTESERAHREIRIFTTSTGSDESLVTWDAGRIERLHWSPDGATLLAAAPDLDVDPRLRLWSVGVGDGSVSLWLAADGDVSEGTFSPGEQWVAYTSNETGERQVYVRPFAGEGDIVRVSTSGGRSPTWRGDGRELFYIALDGDLMAVDVDSTEELTLSSPRRLFHMADWEANTQYDVTPDGQRFLVRRRGPASLHLVQQWPELLRE
jgi:Tol biopolymer transport system component